ncbi:MAG: hypothetical protein ACN6RG_07315 [Stenotrophomonas sp.]
MKWQHRMAAPLFSMALIPAMALAEESRQEVHPARFTGPLITSNPAAYTPGHFYLQPYLINTRQRGYYDSQGNRFGMGEHGSDLQLSLLAGYGINERLTGQLSLSAGRARIGQQRADGLRFGDSTLKLNYVLRPRAASTGDMVISTQVSQTLATGSYDKLGGNALNGRGNGARRTALSLVGQQWLPMSSGHTLRWRWQVGWSPSPGRVDVEGTSVFGTGHAFRGAMHHGSNTSAAVGFEYSLSPDWALALDVTASRDGRAVLQGCHAPAQGRCVQGQRRADPRSRSFSAAPAIEYIHSDRVGFLLGAELSLPGGRNSASFVSPQFSAMLTF